MENFNGVYLAIGLLAFSGGGILTWVTFFINRGRSEADAETAGKTASTALAKIGLLEADFAEYKIKVAEKYVTNDQLAHTEQRIVTLLEQLRSEMGKNSERLDRLVETILRRHSGEQ